LVLCGAICALSIVSPRSRVWGEETMRTLISVVALAAILGGAASASAQNYPSRAITMVVGFAAGGPTDTTARIVAERMRASLSQNVIIENVTGANGSIAVGRVARATPDGYTISMGDWGTYVANGAIYALTYDLVRDFEPITLIRGNPYLITAKDFLNNNCDDSAGAD
jgi:tripartite-type tricarboxylate transporter receptor subunit TctC